MAPLYVFYNGPYTNSFNSGRFSFYSVTGTPTVKMDGSASSYTPSTYPAAIANRLAVPCHVAIETQFTGDSTGGTGTFFITAEDDPGTSGVIKVWSVVIQDSVTAAGSGWGGYAGKELMWLPVAWPLGTAGQALSFTGPYPQTVEVSGDYTLNPARHLYDDLRVVTWVQLATGTRQVLNANYRLLADPQGFEGPAIGSVALHAGPNPCGGQFTVSATLPEGLTGTVSVFDIAGRMLESFPAGSARGVSVDNAGLYFVRLVTVDGETAGTRIAVVR